MKIKVNGEAYEIVSGISLLELLAEKGLNPQMVVVELNYSIVSRDQWDATVLKEEDNVEILAFVGGGC